MRKCAHAIQDAHFLSEGFEKCALKHEKNEKSNVCFATPCWGELKNAMRDRMSRKLVFLQDIQDLQDVQDIRQSLQCFEIWVKVDTSCHDQTWHCEQNSAMTKTFFQDVPVQEIGFSAGRPGRPGHLAIIAIFQDLDQNGHFPSRPNMAL